jgi:hypothetical protein
MPQCTPTTQQKNLLETIPVMEEWGIKENVGVHECNIVSFKNSTMYLQHNNKNLLKLKRKNFVVFLSDVSQLHQGYQKCKASTINFISEIFCSHCQDDM